MKVVVFSDVHGNLPSLEKLFRVEKDADLFISLGDVVNYGPWNNECVNFLEDFKLKVIKILGNHEEYFIKGYCNNKNELVKTFFDFCIMYFNQKDKISRYVDNYLLNDFICKHTIHNRYIFAESRLRLNNNYIIGHSHKQYKIFSNGFYLYNPGSLGQNRYNLRICNYLIFYLNTITIEFKYIEINQKSLINEMIRKKYPKVCIDYYLNKLTK